MTFARLLLCKKTNTCLGLSSWYAGVWFIFLRFKWKMEFIWLHDRKITAKRCGDTLWHFAIIRCYCGKEFSEKLMPHYCLLILIDNRIASRLILPPSINFSNHSLQFQSIRDIVYSVRYNNVLHSLLEVVSYQTESTFIHSFLEHVYLSRWIIFLESISLVTLQLQSH